MSSTGQDNTVPDHTGRIGTLSNGLPFRCTGMLELPCNVTGLPTNAHTPSGESAAAAVFPSGVGSRPKPNRHRDST